MVELVRHVFASCFLGPGREVRGCDGDIAGDFLI